MSGRASSFRACGTSVMGRSGMRANCKLCRPGVVTPSRQIRCISLAQKTSRPSPSAQPLAQPAPPSSIPLTTRVTLGNSTPARTRVRFQGAPAHAASRLRLRPRQQGARHAGDPGMAGTPVDHQHRRLHSAGAEQVQGLLAGLGNEAGTQSLRVPLISSARKKGCRTIKEASAYLRDATRSPFGPPCPEQRRQSPYGAR